MAIKWLTTSFPTESRETTRGCNSSGKNCCSCDSTFKKSFSQCFYDMFRNAENRGLKWPLLTSYIKTGLMEGKLGKFHIFQFCRFQWTEGLLITRDLLLHNPCYPFLELLPFPLPRLCFSCFINITNDFITTTLKTFKIWNYRVEILVGYFKRSQNSVIESVGCKKMLVPEWEREREKGGG